MAGPLIYDRVCETTTTTGTGTLTLAGAVTGFQAFSVVGDANTCAYCIEGIDGSGVPSGEWEVGIGTYTASGTTLARTKVLASSNAGAAVSLSAGTKRVFLTKPASELLPLSPCDGRLTLESGVAVSTTDQTAKTSVYFTPYRGNLIALYNGSSWVTFAFSELTLALGTITSGKNYDIFIYDNAGTLTLELSAAWTTDIARADALTTQDGVEVKSGATTRRYLGTIRTTATTTTEDSADKRLVWNQYNQSHRILRVESTSSHTYGTGTFRSWNAATTNRIQWVCGEADNTLLVMIGQDTTASRSIVGIGLDSTSVEYSTNPSIRGDGAIHVEGGGVVKSSLGFHYLQALEYWVSGGTTFSAFRLEGRILC